MVAFRSFYSRITSFLTSFFSAGNSPRRFLLGISSCHSFSVEATHLESQLISALHVSTNLTQLNEIHTQILRKGLEQSSLVLAKLIRMLTKHNIPMHPYARSIFDQVHQPNSFLWTALIRGYALLGPFKESLLLYTRMRMLGNRPLSFTFSALFKACAAAFDLDVGRQMHAQTITLGGFQFDLFVNNTMISMYVACGCLESARGIFDEMPLRDVVSWTSLIVAYAKNGAMEEAGKLFDRLPEKDMVAWTALISGYTQNARPRDALDMFERMRDAGIKTDEVTLVGVISACAQLGALKNASWICNVAEREGFDPGRNVVVGSALIDMYSKCGCVEEAYRVFEGMRERNVFSYSAMISGFAMHGQAYKAIDLFEKMVETDIRPNWVTFIGLLTACNHAGMVDQGCQYFARMTNDYGVTPSADHYACMVDLLGRAGNVEKAYGLVKTLSIEPHAGVWGALLGACRIHGKPDIAEVAANHLFKLEPNGIGNYVLLSNIYASAGRWDDVSRIRKLMREKGLRKNPGCSLVEGKDSVHEFFAGDMSHPNSQEIKQALEDLMQRLKQEGFVPKLSSAVYNLGDEEKERLLMTHSEKLAVAFGLLNTSSGSVIRIVKNIRMCEDCHSFMCGVSSIEGREIVVRDNMRFHHFKDGVCSCSGFW